jgi:hypothetical protein
VISVPRSDSVVEGVVWAVRERVSR